MVKKLRITTTPPLVPAMAAILGVAALAAAVLAGPDLPRPTRTTDGAVPDMSAANRAYYFGDYATALSIYMHHAADGNAEAAERAGLMLLAGPGLYGRQVRADPDRAAALLEEAAWAGRQSAVQLLNLFADSD
jgi:TPR repeat protein